MDDNLVQELNVLGNLYLKALYGFTFLSEVFSGDPKLGDYSKDLRASAEVARKNFQKILNNLNRQNARFVVVTPTGMDKFDLEAVINLDYLVKKTVENVKKLEKELEEKQKLESIDAKDEIDAQASEISSRAPTNSERRCNLM